MYRKQQQGAALVIGLMVLLVVTLIGISSMSSTTTELKIANNMQTHNSAFQIAESAIRTVIDPANGTVNWTLGTPQSFPDVHSRTQSDGSILTADILVNYTDCLTVGDDMGLRTTGNLENEDVPTKVKGIVQDTSSIGKMLNASGVQIAQAGILIGKKTERPGCPNQ